MTEVQQYLFDLQGYLVIEDVLSGDEVAVLNELFDEQGLPPPGKTSRFGAAPDGAGYLQWGRPLCDLLDHPDIMPVLRFRLGDCFRLDRLYGMYMREGMGRGGLHSDYGASEPFTRAQPGQPYTPPAHQAVHGFGVAAFNLMDSGPETGGLRVIPGSHNSHFKLPRQIREDECSDVAVCPIAPAGSVTLFSEATTHGTATWRADYERRTLLYKYCASQLVWSRTRVTAPDGAGLTKRQEQLLETPAGGRWFFSSLFEDPESD